MAPTRGFAYAVSVALVLVLGGLPVSMAGMVLNDSALLNAGFALLTVGGAAVVVLLIMLGTRGDAKA
jgi:hypothetical protein